MSKLLLNERPLIILPELAVAIGLNEAIVLQQVHYWLLNFEEANTVNHFRDGRWWVYNSVRQWCDQFPFWSYDTIKRTLASLRKPYDPKDKKRRVTRAPLLLTANYNRAGFDKTTWYSIDYDEVDKVEGVPQRLGQNAPTLPSEQGQNAPMDKGKMHQPIPETTTKTNRAVVVGNGLGMKQQQSFDALVQFGVGQKVARELALLCGLADVKAMIDYARHTKCNNPVGLAIAKLRKGEPAPRGPVEADPSEDRYKFGKQEGVLT